MVPRLRREALETMYRAQRLEAKGERTLDEVRELLIKVDVLIDLLQDAADSGKQILERLDHMTKAIEQRGLAVNPTISGTVIPIGANVSIPEESKS